jgi:hypothetical protein
MQGSEMSSFWLRREGSRLSGFAECSYESVLTTASASISTSISGETRPFTSTIVEAGRMFRKNSPCALPIFSSTSRVVDHSAMFVTNTRVRTTSLRLAPAFRSAGSMFLMA